MSAVLYTPEILGLAIELAGHPLDGDLPVRAEARSRSCGSTIVLGLFLDREGRIVRLGMRSHACAIGQASAAIFARGAAGRDVREVTEARDAVARWLAGDGDLPQWPGLEIIGPARAYAARHGAVLLPWDAAVRAFAERELPSRA
ncbi:iron-sulfur cluster assembly scaffold protein [Novosphingobium panipatense]|uniref:iron-sulfur cluster assembly scaffold protein n=1 Tax=Novosphingobium TaxID=165696 RepID=UPI0018EDAB19|nr:MULTISPECIES: iron-sulfur cluster assembly scaffold protein [Novosphingobium]